MKHKIRFMLTFVYLFVIFVPLVIFNLIKSPIKHIKEMRELWLFVNGIDNDNPRVHTETQSKET
jgi:hypothetical protein